MLGRIEIYGSTKRICRSRNHWSNESVPPWASGNFRVGTNDAHVLGEAPCRNVWAELVDLGAATLDQNNQHNGEQNAGYNANESYAVHGESS